MTHSTDSRITALLAMTGNPPTLPEWESAIRATQTRFLKLAPGIPAQEPLATLEVAQDITLWFQRLTRAISANFRTVPTANYEVAMVLLTGHQSDVALATQVLQAAKQGAQRLAAAWWQAQPLQPLPAMEDYLHGIAARLDTALAQQVADAGYGEMLYVDFTEGTPYEDIWEVETLLHNQAAFDAALRPGG